MPDIRKARNASANTQGTGQPEMDGGPLGPQQSAPSMDIGLTQQAKLDMESDVRQVAIRPCRGCDFETATPSENVLPTSLYPHPEWSVLDSESSVMGSLLALNTHLMSYERERLRRAS